MASASVASTGPARTTVSAGSTSGSDTGRTATPDHAHHVRPVSSAVGMPCIIAPGDVVRPEARAMEVRRLAAHEETPTQSDTTRRSGFVSKAGPGKAGPLDSRDLIVGLPNHNQGGTAMH